MAKKKASAPAELNMSQAIRDVLAENPKASSAEAIEAILAKHPKAIINKNSFGVAFYTGRQKMGIGGRKRRGKKVGIRRSMTGSGGTNRNGVVDMDTLSAAAKFLREAGSVEDALAAIKSVQAIQIGE